jgi:hypothetical protein
MPWADGKHVQPAVPPSALPRKKNAGQQRPAPEEWIAEAQTNLQLLPGVQLTLAKLRVGQPCALAELDTALQDVLFCSRIYTSAMEDGMIRLQTVVQALRRQLAVVQSDQTHGAPATVLQRQARHEALLSSLIDAQRALFEETRALKVQIQTLLNQQDDDTL